MIETPVKTPLQFGNFPDPRPGHKRPKLEGKPSVDAILQRTNPSERPASDLVYLGVEDCFATLEAEEFAFKEKEREMARLRAETEERIRVVKETEILLEAREKLLDDREEMLAGRMNHHSSEGESAALDKSLKDTRQALNFANKSIAEKETIIAALRAELEQLKAARPIPASGGADSALNSYHDITHKSLAEQVAFLREREAFIEQSENTLFDTAQNLQEWEARLEQREHDQEQA